MEGLKPLTLFLLMCIWKYIVIIVDPHSSGSEEWSSSMLCCVCSCERVSQAVGKLLAWIAHQHSFQMLVNTCKTVQHNMPGGTARILQYGNNYAI
jgi:hypothetical protein